MIAHVIAVHPSSLCLVNFCFASLLLQHTSLAPQEMVRYALFFLSFMSMYSRDRLVASDSYFFFTIYSYAVCWHKPKRLVLMFYVSKISANNLRSTSTLHFFSFSVVFGVYCTPLHSIQNASINYLVSLFMFTNVAASHLTKYSNTRWQLAVWLVELSYLYNLSSIYLAISYLERRCGLLLAYKRMLAHEPLLAYNRQQNNSLFGK